MMPAAVRSKALRRRFQSDPQVVIHEVALGLESGTRFPRLRLGLSVCVGVLDAGASHLTR